VLLEVAGLPDQPVRTVPSHLPSRTVTCLETLDSHDRALYECRLAQHASFQNTHSLLIDFELGGWIVGGKCQKCVNRLVCVFRVSSCYSRKAHFYHRNRKFVL